MIKDRAQLADPAKRGWQERIIMGSLDILFFAVIAVVIFARLWTVLGQRGEDEPDNRNRPNPFARVDIPDDDDVVKLPAKPLDSDQMAVAGVSANGYALSSLAGNLDQLKQIEPDFQEKAFLAGAKIAFETILKAYAAGDLASVQGLLTAEVHAAFTAAQKDRQARGEILDNRIVRIDDAEIIAAKWEDRRVFLTVQFESLQTNAIRKTDGTWASNPPAKPEKVVDRWVFTRIAGTPDPNWQLCATGV